MKTKPARRLISEDCHTGRRRVIELYHTDERSNQFRVTLDGQPWLERAGLAVILVKMRKAIGRGEL